MTVWLLLLGLLGVGLYGLIAARSLIRKIIGLVLVEHAVNLALILVGYRAGGRPPILLPGEDPAEFAAASVDPLPQALVLTSIVIGLGLVMLMAALVLGLRERAGTTDSTELNRLRG